MKLSQFQSLRKVMLRACSPSLLVYVTFVAPQTAQATPYDWTGLGADANWTTTGNWSPVANPSGTGNTVTINGGTGNPLLNGNYSIGGFTLGTSNTFSPLSSTTVKLTLNGTTTALTSFSNAGTISSDKAGILQILFAPTTGGGTLAAVNSGTIQASGTGSSMLFGINSGTNLKLDNTGGTIQTVGASTLDFGTSTGYAENFWIQGGTISNNSLGTINYGRTMLLGAIVNGGSGAGANGTIFNNGGIFNWSPVMPNSGYGAGINFGLVKTAGTATEFNNLSTGTANFTATMNASSTISATATVAVAAGTTFSNAGIVNLSTVGTGGLVNQGMRLAVTSTTLLPNTITNTGTINLTSKSTFNTTDFNASGVVTLSGSGGKLVMQVGTGGAVDKVGISGSSTAELINSAGHSILGAGTVGFNTLGTLTNNGTINADDASNAMTLDPFAYLAGANNNAGTIRASAAGGLVLGTGVFNNNATGSYQVDAGSSLSLVAGSVLNNNVSGTFTVNGTIASAVGAGTINNASTLTVNSSANSTLNALFTGAGSLVKSGSGSLTLGGANTTTGGVTLNGGTLNVSTGSALGTSKTITSSTTTNTGLVTVTDTSGLVVGQTITGTNIQSNTVITGIISPTQFTISKAVTGAVTTGSIAALSYSTLGTGAVTVNGGILDLGTGSHTVGAVSLTGGAINNGTLTGSSYAVESGNISASLAGSGIALTKTTVGTVTISGSHTYSGDTNVNNGTLVIDGNVSTSAMKVGSNGTLSGVGIVGATDILGTLNIGNSSGTMTFGGDLTLAGGNSNFEINGFSTGEFDLALASATGTQAVKFNGGMLNVLFAPGFSTTGSAKIFDFDTYSGSATTFNPTGLASGYTASFNYLSGTVTVIPEPSVILLSGLGMLALLSRRRK